MKTYILFADKALSFEKAKIMLQSSFTCNETLPNRLTIELLRDHLYIDFDNDIRADYEDEKIRNADYNFYAIVYHSEKLARAVIRELKNFIIYVDDDEGTIEEINKFFDKA